MDHHLARREEVPPSSARKWLGEVCGANTTPEDTGKTSFPVHRSARLPILVKFCLTYALSIPADQGE